MINKIRRSLPTKIFLISCSMLAVCCFLTYMLIIWLVPKLYSNEFDNAMESRVQTLLQTLESSSVEEGIVILSNFDQNNEVYMNLYKSTGQLISFNDLQAEEDDDVGGAVFDGDNEFYEEGEIEKFYHFSFYDSTEIYCLGITSNSKTLDLVVSAFGSIFPIIIFGSISLSIAFAILFTIYVTKPIVRISKTAEKMSELEFSWTCNEKRTDELGELSNSLNVMSGKLSTSMDDLKNANYQLQLDIDKEKKMEKAQLDLFSAVSHEFKTPITILKGQIEGMVYNVGRYKDRDLYLQKCLVYIINLENLVQEIMTMMRVESTVKLLHHEIDLNLLIKEEYEIFEDMILSKQLNWEDRTESGLRIKGDPGRIKKVINNLISNAIHYSPPKNKIIIESDASNDIIHLSITNTGVILNEDEIPKLFNAFYRVERSRNRQTGGSGLGLYIVKAILEQHNAAIDISNTDDGVRVEIFFNYKIETSHKKQISDKGTTKCSDML